MRIAPVLALSMVLAPCALTHDPSRGQWTADWNGRIDTAKTPFDHPCATKAFIAWADGFLIGCVPEHRSADEEASEAPPEFEPAPGCAEREEWVDERVEQCRPWTAWYLRNFNKHERSEGTPPTMRIE